MCLPSCVLATQFDTNSAHVSPLVLILISKIISQITETDANINVQWQPGTNCSLPLLTTSFAHLTNLHLVPLRAEAKASKITADLSLNANIQ